MEELIKAFTILLKYGNPSHPTHCEHDTLYICGYEWDAISEGDKTKLSDLGFFFSDDEDSIISFRYGSA